jgi:hypothetical protein
MSIHHRTADRGYHTIFRKANRAGDRIRLISRARAVKILDKEPIVSYTVARKWLGGL